jgi:hypothetical protein
MRKVIVLMALFLAACGGQESECQSAAKAEGYMSCTVREHAKVPGDSDVSTVYLSCVDASNQTFTYSCLFNGSSLVNTREY